MVILLFIIFLYVRKSGRSFDFNGNYIRFYLKYLKDYNDYKRKQYNIKSCGILFTKPNYIPFIVTSGFATTHVVFSVRPPTNLPNMLKIHTGENKIDR